MDYKDIRTKFCEISGHYELINIASLEDAGADFFLNAAQRALDRQLSSGKTHARYPVILHAGDFIAKSVGLRAIKEVWVANIDGKYQLYPTTLQDLRGYYADEHTAITYAAPSYYAPALFRPFPDALASVAGMYDVEDLLAPGNNHYTYNGVIIMPPVDADYTLTIWGLFYSPALSATLSGNNWTQTKSVWTEVYPDTLIEAALYRLNYFYSNKSAADLHKALMVEDVTGIDFDSVEESIAGESVMEG